MKSSKYLNLWAIAVVAAVLLTAPGASAEDPGTTLDADAGPAPADKVEPADREAQLRASLSGMLNQSSDGLVEVVEPDGGVTVDLQGRFSHVVLSRSNADGTHEIACTDNLEDAIAFLTFKNLVPEQSTTQEIAAE